MATKGYHALYQQAGGHVMTLATFDLKDDADQAKADREATGVEGLKIRTVQRKSRKQHFEAGTYTRRIPVTGPTKVGGQLYRGSKSGMKPKRTPMRCVEAGKDHRLERRQHVAATLADGTTVEVWADGYVDIVLPGSGIHTEVMISDIVKLIPDTYDVQTGL